MEVHWTPDAEIYVTPVAADQVGVAVLGGSSADYDAVIRSTVVADRVADAEPVSGLRGAGPLRQRAAHRVSGRVLLVGDAAGYIDALTGEGIRLGLAQARAAIDAIMADDPGRYDLLWRRITRDYRILTSALLAAGRQPRLRREIVPLARRMPRLYGGLVDRLAG